MTIEPIRPRSRRRHVLITGGLGFIGTHVADAFLAAGHAVTLVDSMVQAVTDGSWYRGMPEVAIHTISIEDYLEQGADLAAFDLVIHAASHVGPASILKYTGRLGFEIVNATHRVIEACLEAGRPLVVFSSAEVYGRSGRLAESDDLIVPVPYSTRVEYAIGKALTEAMTLNSRHRGLKGLVIRPFNVTGSRQSKAGGFVMPTFVQQALSGQPITVFAGGRQTRAFLAATDLARFLVEHLDAALASGHGIVNLGNPDNAVSVLELAHRIKRLAGSTSPIVHVDGKAIHGELYEEAASVDKLPVLDAAVAAGWTPRVGLDELIQQTIAFYRSHRDFCADEAA
ncbi:NAD-dependent epimerase/dehydratase family protein [Benzoatithermus flavus]|uniref:NAD(P)-dependent oxidoreductase n=1 Tax=Benzoatithermus flavus TaxID=3108223 RepID=A0ABU8XWH1_9PROT